MPFDLTDPNDLALFVALVGLAGTVVGALIGFLGTSVATRKQIDLQERAIRRETYADYLGSVMTMQKFHRVARSHAQEHLGLFTTALSYRVEQMNTDDADTKDEIGKAVAHFEQLRDEAAARMPQHTPEFDQVHDELLASAHRLKIVGHPEVHDAAMEVYRWLGFMVEMGKPDDEFDLITDNFNETLRVFSLLARADTKATGEVSWNAARRQAEHRLASIREPESTTPDGEEPSAALNP